VLKDSYLNRPERIQETRTTTQEEAGKEKRGFTFLQHLSHHKEGKKRRGNLHKRRGIRSKIFLQKRLLRRQQVDRTLKEKKSIKKILTTTPGHRRMWSGPKFQDTN